MGQSTSQTRASLSTRRQSSTSYRSFVQSRQTRNGSVIFLYWHLELVLGKPSSLDPKQVQSLNQAIIKSYFKLFSEMKEQFNVLYAHIYNMDEKRVQREGGWKLQALKYFVP